MLKWLKRLLGNDGWHKVSDKLPPENELVAVHGNKGDGACPLTAIGIMHTMISSHKELWVRSYERVLYIKESEFDSWYWKRIGKPKE